MSIERDHTDVTGAERVKREFHDRARAERAAEQLKAAGFGDEQITLTTHGARTAEDGTFIPGGLEIIVTTDDRAEEAERILAQD